MRTMVRRSSAARPAVIAAAALALLSACGTTESAATDSAAAAAPSSATATGPIEVTDERGTVELDAPATTVVSLEWGLTENLLSLGITPAGAADVEGYNDYDTVVPLDPDTPDVGERGTPNTDAISALDPDLIVATTDLSDEVIGDLEKIAPVIALRGSNADDPIGYLSTTVNTLAEATGTEAAASTLLSDLDTRIAEAKTTLADAGMSGAPFTMADGWVQSGTVTVRMYTPGSFLGAVAAELGLDNQWTTGGDADYGLATTDVEGLRDVTDPDSTFLYVEGATDDTFVDALADNAIWKSLPFVKNDNVRPIDSGIWMFGGPKAAEAYIDTVVENLTGSAAS